MKISELIAELEKLKEEHGDLPVGICEDQIYQLEGVEVWAFNLDAESKYTLVLF